MMSASLVLLSQLVSLGSSPRLFSRVCALPFQPLQHGVFLLCPQVHLSSAPLGRCQGARLGLWARPLDSPRLYHVCLPAAMSISSCTEWNWPQPTAPPGSPTLTPMLSSQNAGTPPPRPRPSAVNPHSRPSETPPSSPLSLCHWPDAGHHHLGAPPG